jgi:putative two-component system response regulator
VADVYDVLTSQRPYKAPLTAGEARERLLAGEGKNFDPMVLQAFISLIDSNPNFTLSHREYGIALKDIQQHTYYSMFITGN